ncbi:hypothetical protein GCK72_000172 [Caenorhabditis remanei]|uniref:F-box domain-containing protein n=1 Tax=Caenorhabditis remanei TaxID=31234 RepID=A0A6A5HJJ9_CAERE|nr:hypothetical protein GCK72_000172 [Caenorhabditis remanei]KAF1768360.1 hypothetical protein GCK72_000172 [Caenorhabditis remanei]
MPSASFPLLQLPVLPCKLVFQLLDPVNLVELSLAYRCVNRFLKAYKTHVAQLTWTFDDKDAFPGMFTWKRSSPFYTYMSLTVSFNDGHHIKYYFIGNNQGFRPGSPVETVPGEWPLPIGEFKDNEFWMSGRQTLLEAEPEALDMKVMEKLTKHFSDLFYIDGYNLYYGRIHEFDIFDSFVWNFTRKFKNFSMRKLEINEEDGRFLLEDLEIENLTMEDVNINNFNKITNLRMNMNQSIMEIHDCNWITMSNIIEAHESKLIDIDLTRDLNVNQLVKLVTLWRNGQKLRNLEKLKMDWTRGCCGFDSEDVKEFKKKLESLGGRPHNQTPFQFQVERVIDGEIALLSFELGRQFEMVLQRVYEKEKKEEEVVGEEDEDLEEQEDEEEGEGEDYESEDEDDDEE